ncbi:MAG: glycosyltransferase family 2 protein [Patescibacteria group bacterium]
MSIWFVVVTFHPEKKALGALRKVLDGWPTVVINNSSKNIGFGGGANVGMRYAMERGADWVVILNQDIAMTKEAVKELCERLKGLPAGIAGPFAGTLDPKRWTTIMPANGSRVKPGMTKNVEYISGACMAIHRKVIERVGYFYEPYFMYYEDADLSVRARRHGFPLVHLSVKGITHIEHPVWEKGSRRHEWFLSRNHLLFVLRLAPWQVKLHEIVRLPKTIAEYLQKL